MTKWGRYCLSNMVLKGSCSTDLAICDHLMSSSNSGSTSMEDPLALRRAFLACSILPRSTKLLGVSVMRKAPIVITAAGTTARPRETRHPQVFFAVPKLMQPATSTPSDRKNWKPVLKAPRHFGGAISERYNGAAFCQHHVVN